MIAGGEVLFKNNNMKAIQGYHLIRPEDLSWRLSNMMQIPNADFLERTGSENMAARLWRLPPKSAGTLHKHIRQEEFYFVLEGVGRMRVGGETLTVPRHGGVLVGPDQLRQVFNDTDFEVLWLIAGAPEETEFLPSAKTKPDLSVLYPVDPKQLPKELADVEWPPKSGRVSAATPKAIDFEQQTREWVAAWNSHDLETILGHYTEDVEFISPFVAKLTGRAESALRGKAALREYFARGLASYPSLRFEIIRVYPGVGSCVVEYLSVNNLRCTETMEFNAEGKVRRVLAHYLPMTAEQ